MNPEHDAAEQIVNSATRMAVHTFEVLGSAAAHGGLFLAQYLIAHLKQQHKTKGKTTISNFKDKPTKVFIIQRKDLEMFAREAKKYGVLYAAVMDKKNNDGLVDIIVNDVEAAKVNRIADRFAMGMEDVRRVQEEILQAQADQNVDSKQPVNKQTETIQHDTATQAHDGHLGQPQQHEDGTYSISNAHVDAIFSDGDIDVELLDVDVPVEVEEFSMDESDLDSLFIDDGEYSLDDSQLEVMFGEVENPTMAETDKTAHPSEQRSGKSVDMEMKSKPDDKSVKKKIQDKRQQRRDSAVKQQPRKDKMKGR